jgi:hypothetical protein
VNAVIPQPSANWARETVVFRTDCDRIEAEKEEREINYVVKEAI